MVRTILRRIDPLPEGQRRKISVVMVVRDEEETLAKAIESIRPVADEIVIGVDSVSNSATREIAAKYADTLYEFEWEKDFAKARNEAIEFATGEWIFILDGHEFLTPDSVPVVQGATERMVGVECIFGMLYMEPDQFGNARSILSQPRIFKNDPKIRYKRAIHNDLKGYGKDKVVSLEDFTIVHEMPESRKKWRGEQRTEMNESGLRKIIEEDPEDERATYYLAQTLCDANRPDEAIEFYKKHLEICTSDPYRWQSTYQLGVLSFNSGDHEKTAELMHEAIKIQYDRAEQYMMLALISKQAGRREEALHWAKMASSMRIPKGNVLFVKQAAYTWAPWLMIAELEFDAGNWGEAAEAAHIATDFKPDCNQAHEIAMNAEKRFTIEKKRGGKVVVVFDELPSFTNDIVRHWQSLGHDVRVYPKFSPELVNDADVVYVEWSMNNAAAISFRKWRCPVVVRCHRVEVYGGWISQPNWNNVDDLVFTSDHIRRAALQNGARFPDKLRQHVISSAVDVKAWQIPEDKAQTVNIAYVGYINWKKGLPLILSGMHYLTSLNDVYKLHIAGKFQTPELEEYFYEMLDQLELRSNVTFHGWLEGREKVVEFLSDKSYVVNGSITEGLPYSVSEAMACGLMPLVHTWPGAKELYPERYLWNTPEQFANKVLKSECDPQEYRQFVIDNYDVQQEHEKLDAVMNLQKTDPEFEAEFEAEEGVIQNAE